MSENIDAVRKLIMQGQIGHTMQFMDREEPITFDPANLEITREMVHCRSGTECFEQIQKYFLSAMRIQKAIFNEKLHCLPY